MSKSLGNAIEPEDIIKEDLGAEVLRLWVAMVDYREEIKAGRQVLARVMEATARSATRCAISSRTSTTSIRRPIGSRSSG